MTTNWQYFKPEERPRIANAKITGKAICFQIGDGPAREYYQVNQIGDVYHMTCKEFELQVKRHNNYGMAPDMWSVRAVESEFANANPAEFGFEPRQPDPVATDTSGIPF